jgi:hypothetical protein
VRRVHNQDIEVGKVRNMLVAGVGASYVAGVLVGSGLRAAVFC